VSAPDSDDNIDEWCVEGIPHLFSPDDDIAVDGVSAPDSDDNIDEWCVEGIAHLFGRDDDIAVDDDTVLCRL
jgi:hypothetical protein